MGHRKERVAERILQEASKIIQRELSDPRMKMVSVVRVEPSADLRFAKIFFSVIGSEADSRTAERALSSAKGHIQSLIGSRLGLKYSPRLSFIPDQSIRKSVEICKLIDKVMGKP